MSRCPRGRGPCMNTAQDHLNKAAHNRAFLDSLFVTNANADWASIVLFYRALHLVRAYLHHLGINHGISHGVTNRAVAARFPAAVSVSYLKLYNHSRLYRYEQPAATVQDFADLDRNHFRPALQFVQTALPSAV